MSSSDPNSKWIFRSCTLHSSSRLCFFNLFSSREVSRAVACLCNSVASLHAENAQNNSRVETSLLITSTKIMHDKRSIENIEKRVVSSAVIPKHKGKWNCTSAIPSILPNYSRGSLSLNTLPSSLRGTFKYPSFLIAASVPFNSSEHV